MTARRGDTGGGERDDDDRLLGALYDDDAAEGGDDEVARMRDLRGVFRAMHDDDQEPSDRGLAALLAAAREHAPAPRPVPVVAAASVTTLAKPGLLARLGAGLRALVMTPSFAAAAALVVVAGVGATIYLHGDAKRADTTATAQAPAGAADQQAREGQAELRRAEVAANADRPPPAAEPEAPSAPSTPTVATRDVPNRQKAAGATGAAVPPGVAFAPKDDDAHAGLAFEEGLADGKRAPNQQLGAATVTDVETETAAGATPDDEVAGDTAAIAEPSKNAVGNGQGAQDLPSLYRRAHDAAVQKDCMIATALGETALALDRTYYEKKFASDPAITACRAVAQDKTKAKPKKAPATDDADAAKPMPATTAK